MDENRITEKFISCEPVDKGWSGDKKYCAADKNGGKYFLRISPYSRYDNRKALFEIMKKLEELDIPMGRPAEFGVCGSSVYLLDCWIEGEDAEKAVPLLTETEQYVLGYKSGEILRKIHSIPAPDSQEDWKTRFNRKTDTKIRRYLECGIRFKDDDKIIEYIEQNRELLKNRPQTFQHGDYHIGNMLLNADGLYIIDFDRYDYGDPWEEFNRIVWCAQKSPYFATGQLRGYFGGEPPMEFFRLLAFYIASNTLSSIYWAIPFGQKELDTMLGQSQEVLSWYGGMRDPVPSWYIKDFYVQRTDNVPYKLAKPYDFGFLRSYGKVFKVFDDQDSGNICFGTEKDGKKYFIKFAGAPTARYSGDPEEAVKRLQASAQVYRDLAHENLIKLVKTEEAGGGYAAVFEWAAGESMGRMYPLSRRKFMAMPDETKFRVFMDVLAFHAYAEEHGYTAIDFYDASVMYDFTENKTVICDIDFYAKKPYINMMGRMWGSSKFKSLEEYEYGAEIDGVSNIYTMGAFGFALFADYGREQKNWRFSGELYNVIKKAVSAERSERQQSVRELIAEWKTALQKGN